MHTAPQMAASPIRCMYPAPELPDVPAVSPMSRRKMAGLSAKLRHGCAAGRRFQARPAALPLVLLLLALATLFLFGGDREYFYRYGHHDWNSSKILTLAENLSFRHNLLVFYYPYRDTAGNTHYSSLYNRFPLGGYVLVKLAIFPFGDTDFRAKIYAGRMLMLLLFSAAAVLAYLSLARIAGSRWDALTATLLAFSSYYLLYYADQISNEITMDLFAVMLAFHGMTVFVQEGRFRQLVVKSCLALLLGWHVYAFLLPFIVFGLAIELIKARRFYHPLVLRNIKWLVADLLRSRYLLLGVVTLLFGIAVLSFNFSTEYFALNGKVPVWELPSVASAVNRFGGNSENNAVVGKWVKPQVFWPAQFYRIAATMLPYAVNPYEIKEILYRYGYRDYPGIALGVLAVGFGLAGLAFSGIRRQTGSLLLLATLTFSGFCWAAPLRYNVAFHDFESVFYIGIPLVAYILALRFLRRWHRGRLATHFAVATLVVFVLSVSAMTSVGQSRAELSVEAEQMAEYAAIRELMDRNTTVYVTKDGNFSDGGAEWAWEFYLSGKSIIFSNEYGPRKPPPGDGDYMVLFTHEDNPALLTPEHRHIFLYDSSLYDEWLRTVDWGRPIIAAEWQVYLRDGRLTYVSPKCAHREESFFLHFAAREAADLPAERREYGFDNRDFAFQYLGIILADGTCIIERPLPEYDIAVIHTGQYNTAGRIWGGEYRLPAP